MSLRFETVNMHIDRIQLMYNPNVFPPNLEVFFFQATFYSTTEPFSVVTRILWCYHLNTLRYQHLWPPEFKLDLI
jgi:hypothetical protein